MPLDIRWHFVSQYSLLPMSIATFYESTLSDCNSRVRSLRKRMNLVALVRLVVFAGLAYTVYLLIREFTSLLLILSLVLAAAFIGCVNLYFRLKDERALWEKLSWINANELGLLKDETNGFSNGSSFLDSDNYLDDLDIFGNRSLFHVLNRTTTSHGTNALARILRNSFLSVDQ